MFYANLNGHRRAVLADSGCTGSCMSYDHYVNNPALKKSFVPGESCGTAINGTKVPSIGEVRLNFRLDKTHMSIACKVIKGLMDPVVLGWDWMCKYKVMIDAANGKLHYLDGLSTSLVRNPFPMSGCFYRVFEDVTLPPNSKVHTDVELMVDNGALDRVTPTVATEPFSNNGSNFWAARTCSNVNGRRFMTEFINATDRSVKVEAGSVVGFAEFVDEEKFGSATHTTDMYCSYQNGECGTDPPPEVGSEPEPESRSESEAEQSEEDQEPERPPRKPPPEVVNAYASNVTDGTPEIPPGAKVLKIDYSKLAEDAQPYTDRLKDLFENKHKEAFSKHNRDYGLTKLIQYRAHMKDPNENPIAQPPYRTRPEMREIIDCQAHEMIADGLVGHSKSPFSAPILLSKKKCGGWRFLTDFRKVNERCNKVVYPLPRIEDSIQRLENPRFFSSMDLTKGFWQIPIHPDDRKFFAFSTESMHLEYLVAPMGAKNSPSYLSSLMQLILRGLPIQHVISYLDDILVADTNMEDHIKHLDLVLSALIKAGLKLNPSKCSFAQESVVCLGHKLSRDGVSPDPANIEKIKSWKAPTNAKKLRAFLGLTGYYRQFVKSYSGIAGCLTDLTRNDAKWQWGPEHQKAFETLRDTLISDQIMSYPNFSLPFIVKTDASLTAIGYVLTQKVEGKERVISYGSKKLSCQQQRWSTYDREFFAMIAAVRANAHYLRHAKFAIITDHRPLLAWRKVDTKKDPTGRRTRWAIELDNYEFDLVYKKGKTHCDADAMSRRGDEDDEVAEDDDCFFCLFDPTPPSEPALLTGDVGDEAFLGMCGCDGYYLACLNAHEEDMEKLKYQQDSDPIVTEVKKFVKDRKSLPRSFPSPWYHRNFKWLTIREGILYRKSYADTIHDQVLQAVIPDSMVADVLDDLHGSVWAGHPSARKMVPLVQRYAIWPTLATDIKDRVTNCKICDQLREQVPKPVTPLQPIIAKSVFDHVMCDLLSFPIPSYGFKYVLIFKDVFTGFIKCYKLRNKTTDGVVKAFEDLVCSLGPPRLLTSDNGGEFISDALKQACVLIGVEKRTSVPYRPQSQGNVERQNRTLIKDLQKRLLQHGKTWVDHLPYTEWSHNTTPFSKTGMSPYFLFFGREPFLPSFATPADTVVKDIKSSKFLSNLREKLLSRKEEAIKRADEKREQEAASYNRKVKHVPYEVGDKVWEYVDVRHKLQPKWSGPVTVTSRRPNSSGAGTTYTCERPNGSTCRRNYEQLKKVNARYEELMKTPPEPRGPMEEVRVTRKVSMLPLILAPPPSADAWGEARLGVAGNDLPRPANLLDDPPLVEPVAGAPPVDAPNEPVPDDQPPPPVDPDDVPPAEPPPANPPLQPLADPRDDPHEDPPLPPVAATDEPPDDPTPGDPPPRLVEPTDRPPDWPANWPVNPFANPHSNQPNVPVGIPLQLQISNPLAIGFARHHFDALPISPVENTYTATGEVNTGEGTSRVYSGQLGRLTNSPMAAPVPDWPAPAMVVQSTGEMVNLSSIGEALPPQEDNNAGNITALSVAPSSVSSLNRGFIDELDVSDLESESANAPSETPEIQVVPTENRPGQDSSPEFHTPTLGLPRRSLSPRGKGKGKCSKARRPIDLLTVAADPHSSSDTLIAGEVSSEPNTPTLPVEQHNMWETSAPDKYLVEGPTGRLAVNRVRSDDLGEFVSSLGASLPSLPDFNSERRELRTKIKSTNSRPRATSVSSVYSGKRSIRNNANNQEEPSEPEASKTSGRHASRATSGRYTKKPRATNLE